MRVAVLLVFVIFSLSLAACQTSRAVSFAYQDATYGGDVYKPSDRTSVLFLMDGFSSEMLRTSLQTDNVPNIATAFSLTRKARFSYGRAVFPSLTFPNITSILTMRSDAEHPITGNRIIADGKVIDFENVTNWRDLAMTLQRRTIFYKLGERSQSSVSYSYAFSGGATAFQETSPEAAVSYLENDFATIDTQTLQSLQKLLTETQPSKWPRFIFVHLVGIDATAHMYGPLDEHVQRYIHSLDAQLGEIFSILDHPGGREASTREVNYAMTADHGFKTTPDHSPLEDVILHMNRRLRVLPDNRVASVFIDEPLSADGKFELAKALLQVPHVGWAAVKTETGIDLLRRSGGHARITIAKSKCPNGDTAARFEWMTKATSSASDSTWVPQIRNAVVPAPARQTASTSRAIASLNETSSNSSDQFFTCLTDFDLATGPEDDSYIVPALVNYFQAANSPDLVFIPDDHADFAKGYAGNHGGLSRDEMLVPMLTKDVDVTRGIHPTYEILKTMGLGEGDSRK